MPITDMLPGSRRKGWRRWGFAVASAVVHAGLLAALVVATDEEGEAAPEVEPDAVTYVDITRFAPPPPPTAASPEPATPDPQPVQPEPQATPPRPEPQPRQAETPPRAADILEPEDSIPDEPLGREPPLQPAAPRVSPAAPTGSVAPVRGSGTGGREGGVEGGKEGGVVGGQGEEVPDPDGTYVAAVVDRQAELTNRRDLARILQRLYPAALRDARQGGRVVVQFVVQANGRVDMSSVKIMSSSHEGFEGPTREALQEFRFRPAQMGDRKVRMLTQLPIVWEVR